MKLPEHQDPVFLAALKNALVRASAQVEQEVNAQKEWNASQQAVLTHVLELTEEAVEIKKRLRAGDLSAVEDYRDLKRRFEEFAAERGLG